LLLQLSTWKFRSLTSPRQSGPMTPADWKLCCSSLTRDGGSEGGGGGSSPLYCLRNKETLLQPYLKFSTINECLGVEEAVHTLACTTMEPSFTLL
jgi:hypothetical protein